MKNDPASRIQDLRQFGEFGGVNPSITDSSTFTGKRYRVPRCKPRLFQNTLQLFRPQYILRNTGRPAKGNGSYRWIDPFFSRTG